MNQVLKTVKVLCVVKDNHLLTRVVRQDMSYQRQELGVLGSLEIKIVNSPELRSQENTLFLRGDQFESNHKVDTSFLTMFDMAKALTLLKNANKEYHEKVSV
jgi:hypothetical protein